MLLRARSWAVIGLLVLMTSPWHGAASGTEESVLELSSFEIEPGGEVSVSGLSSKGLHASHELLIQGSLERGLMVEWSEDGLKFQAPFEPGDYDVILASTSAPPISLGQLKVKKLRLPGTSEFMDGVIKVRVAPGADISELLLSGDKAERAFPLAQQAETLSRWYVVHVPSGAVDARIEAYAANTAIEVSEFEAVARPARAPNDPYYSSQWNIRKARLTAAWEMLFTGQPIAIVDSGVLAAHEDLVGRVIQNKDCTVGTLCMPTVSPPCDSHGTEVSSVAAASTQNSKGIAGGAWNGVIGSYKIASSSGCNAPSGAIERAVDAAYRDGFPIINISYGAPGLCPSSMAAVMNAAWNAGSFVVAAAGNGNSTAATFPSSCPRVFAVANSSQSDDRGFRSNYGAYVDLAAPGENIIVANSAGTSSYSYSSGTSLSSPLLAAAASLLRTAGLSNAETEARLVSYADPIPWENGRSTPTGQSCRARDAFETSLMELG